MALDQKYKRMVKIFLAVYSTIIGHFAFAQPDSSHFSTNEIFFEAAGIGGYGSINYERIQPLKNNFTIGLRIGISSYHIRDFTNNFNPDIHFPIHVNTNYGNIHKIEWGLGTTYSSTVYANLIDFTPNRNHNFHTNLYLGYRYQKRNGGIFFLLISACKPEPFAFNTHIEAKCSLKHSNEPFAGEWVVLLLDGKEIQRAKTGSDSRFKFKPFAADRGRH